jgi:cation:H+ antiporter
MRALVIYGLSALVIFLASPFMAGNAGKIADMTGLGRTFIGSTLVAFSTSLPEVVSTVAAVRMGAFDLAVGNIFGSNTFNMFLFVPLDFFHSGSLMGAVSKNHVLTALGVIMTTSVAVMGQLYHEERRKTLIEPDAVAVIGLVLGSFFTLYWLG